ncbi:HlyD family secretion protein [Sandaracinus amylolyticus]|uniref:HlyD family secretion protein n=1 Tax=Sandaracinus amylolyticus TaxID=927083 RepID=UPI001F34C910|nr:HlyD family efflux transporter periplasmic adaptor subunit [Sandaracinus amylolyticus]UJR87185.1 Hypothetical protein I5071_92860 [Sandaracinus amylolyticus]
MKRVVAAGTVLVLLLVLALTLRIRAQREAQSGPPGGAGVVEAVAVDVGSRISGRIVRLQAREGAEVHAGDALLELDCMQERARLAEAEARIEAARAQLAGATAAVQTASRSTVAASAAARAAEVRISAASVQQETYAREAARVASLGPAASAQARDMAQSQASGAETEVEAARAQSRATRAQIGVARTQVEAADAQARAAASTLGAFEALRDLARIAVDECVVRAPRDGVLEEVYYEAGEIVTPGAIVVRLVDLSEVRATFYLPNAELSQARTDREAEVVADAWPDQRFAGRVITVANEAEFTPRNIQTRTDRDRLVYAIEVAVPNPERRLRPGMPVQVTLR